MTITTLQPDETSGSDAFMDNSNAWGNTASSVNLGVGERDDLASTVYRTLIKFDLSVIPRSARIIRADLTLTIDFEHSSNIRAQKIYRVLRNWDEAIVSWNQYSTGNLWTAAGCSSAGNDYDPTVWASLTMGTAESGAKTWSLDLTEFTKMINGSYPNYGWLIAADTQNNDAIVYCSSSHATAGNRPKLEVEYAIFGGQPMISPFGKF